MGQVKFTSEFQVELGQFYVDRYNITDPRQFPQKAWERTTLEREAAAGNTESVEFLRRYNEDGCYPSSATVVGTHKSWGTFLESIGLRRDPRERLKELRGEVPS